jgi:hypothetical protein
LARRIEAWILVGLAPDGGGLAMADEIETGHRSDPYEAVAMSLLNRKPHRCRRLEAFGPSMAAALRTGPHIALQSSAVGRNTPFGRGRSPAENGANRHETLHLRRLST